MPAYTVRKVAHRGQQTEGIFANQLVYLVLESVSLARNTVNVIFAGISIVGRLGAATLGCPDFLVCTPKGHILTVDIQHSFHGRQCIMVFHFAGGIQGFDLDVLFTVALAILAKQQPCQCIVNTGLAGSIVAVDSSITAVKC